MTVARSMFRDQESYDLYTSSFRHVISLSSVVPPKAASAFYRFTRAYTWAVAKDDSPYLLQRLFGSQTTAYCEAITEKQAAEYSLQSHSIFHENSLSCLPKIQVINTVFFASFIVVEKYPEANREESQSQSEERGGGCIIS